MTNNYFKYWNIVLYIFGIYSVENTSSTIRKILQKLISSLVYCLICFTSYGDFMDLINRINNSENVSQAVGFVGYHAAVLATYAVLQCKRQLLHNFLKNLSEISEDISRKKHKQIMLLKMLCVVCPLPFSLFHICNVTLINPDTREMAHTMMWAVVVNPLNMFFTFFSVFICYILDSIFEQFKTEIKIKLDKKMDHFAWRQLVKHFIARHKKLSQLVDDFENIYANIYLIYFVLYTALTIFLIRGLNLNGAIEKWNFNLILPVLQAVALFLFQVFTVSRVNSQVLSSVYLMKPQPLIPNWVFENIKINTVLTNSELSLYIQQVCANPSVLTAGNYFTINKGVILSAGATILTYILVLYGNNN